MIFALANPLDHVVAHKLFTVGPIVVTNHMFMLVVAGIVLIIVLPLIFRKGSLVPTKLQNIVESICLYFREVAQPMLKEHTDKYMGYIWTTFFFILTCNLLGLLPISELIYLLSLGKLKHFGGTATGNIYVTGALAVLAYFVVNLSGIWMNIKHFRYEKGHNWLFSLIVGFFAYWYKLVPHIEGWIGRLLFPMLFLIEFAGLIIKSAALAIRLFANMLGGHTVLAVFLFFIAMCHNWVAGLLMTGISSVTSVAFMCLELFVAFLQAYIFTMLVIIFISQAVYQEH